eukprot:14431502-Alexandrium_andersonii.AAC.1
MSASLVGSEMCIRDRRWLESHPPKKDTAGKRDDKAIEQIESVIKAGVPVSYTHLTLPTICSV